jgi:peptide chain release factor
MKLAQISSGRGPVECELAVGLYLAYFLRRHPQAQVIKTEGEGLVKVEGRGLKTYRSVELRLPEGESAPVGSIRWRAKSPLRKNHDRQNWFIQVSVVAEEPTGLTAQLSDPSFERELRFSTFRSPGKGGQNVNKVETGVRVTHLPSGLTAVSTTARTQKANKTLALARLRAKLALLGEENEKKAERNLWLKHSQLERGNAVQTFEGLEFRLVFEEKKL